MHPTAEIRHQTGRRIRLHVPSKKRDSAYFDRLEEKLGEIPGVSDVETNHITGSVLIKHTTDVDAIRRFAEHHGLFSLAEAAGTAVALAARIHEHMNDVDDQVLDFTRGHMDLRSVILVALAGGAVYQIFRKEVMPPAFNLIWASLALIWPKHPDFHTRGESPGT
jgi:copper chaperone CopZ